MRVRNKEIRQRRHRKVQKIKEHNREIQATYGSGQKAPKPAAAPKATKAAAADKPAAKKAPAKKKAPAAE
ncbi:MAG: hypothetical protein JST35_08950 [Armatimonadetes bacterium]|jgi:hypothetical protein|nr:hypothetical protein [Armatimonadota bacterium]